MMLLIAVAGVVFVAFVVMLILLKRFYRRVAPGEALVISKPNGRARVSFSGAMVIPLIEKAAVLDITTKTIGIELDGAEALVCKDNVRAAIRCSFYVGVNKTQEDVLKVAQTLGCERASDVEAVRELFRPKCVEALRTAARQLEYVELERKLEDFRDTVIYTIGQDLNGFSLEDCAVELVQRAAPIGEEQGPFR